jgi:hypothetical protein
MATRLPARSAGAALLRCALRTFALLARRRIHQPAGHVGDVLRFADGTSARVYRETVVDRRPTERPAVLVVEFRLRRVRRPWAHALFRLESVLNTVLFVGFAGFVSKLWCAHDEHHVYRGIYQWDGPALAERYVRALWWPLALVATPSSIRHVVLPGLDRDEFLRDPHLAGTVEVAGEDPWWRPVEAASG